MFSTKSLASLKNVCQDYHSLISRLESEKIDYEYEVARKNYEARQSSLFHLHPERKQINHKKKNIGYSKSRRLHF